ncbi:Uncharacterised protein [Mycobacteroides abscessus subsp. abscessus]|nr:Uncharacterised protein [Mycobacteroides abscessus subsp. abscessus]
MSSTNPTDRESKAAVAPRSSAARRRSSLPAVA